MSKSIKNSQYFCDKRATIVIKCDMDFVLYPLDVQKCPVDFSSCKIKTNLTLENTNIKPAMYMYYN